MEHLTAKPQEKELVCIFLGLEFYTTPKKAKILKSRVKDILLRGLQGEDLIAVEMQPAVDLTPTFTRVTEKYRKRGKGQKEYYPARKLVPL